jgi:hypothetical protein
MNMNETTERWSWLSPARFAMLLALLVFAAHVDVALGLRSFVARDFGGYTLPLAQYHRETFWKGEWPLWNPFSRCGMPFLAQWNTVTCYPLSLIYLLLPMPWSVNFFCLLHQFWAGLGMYFLARRWTGNSLAAAVAGVGFAFNGITVSALNWTSIMAGLGWMPWVIWFAERTRNEGGRVLLLAAGVGAMQMLSGAAEVILLTWVALGTLWLNQTAVEKGGWKISLGRIALVLLLIAALSAIQLVPFLDLLQHSHRTVASGAGDKWWLAPWGVANLLVPMFRVSELTCGLVLPANQSWLPSYYPGIGMLAFCLWGTLTRRNWRARWLTGLLLFGLWLALGNSGGLLKILRVLFPPLNLIRYPVKYMILVGFAAPLLAALALKSWLEAPKESIKPLRVSGGLIVVLLSLATMGIISWSLLWPTTADEATKTWHSGLSRSVFLVAVTLLTLFIHRQPGWLSNRLERFAAAKGIGANLQQLIGIGLLVLLWLDALTHAPSPNPTTSSSVFATPGPATMRMEQTPVLGQGRTMVALEVLDGLSKKTVKDVGTTYLIQRMGLYGNCNLLEDIPIVEGFFPLMLEREQQLYPCLLDRAGNPRNQWADFLGVKQVMLSEQTPVWRARTTAHPLITSGHKPIFTDGTNALSLIASDEFNPERMVALPTAAQENVNADGLQRAEISDERFGRDRVEFVAEAKAPSLVVIAQSHYHWWRAEVDSLSVPLWPANHQFQCLQVAAGRHRVKLAYRDRGFQLGGFISVVAFCGCVAGLYRLKPAKKCAP